MKKKIVLITKLSFGSVFALALVLAGLVAWPRPLFAYGVAVAGLEIRSDRPIPEVQGKAFLVEVAKRLDSSVLKRKKHRYTLYVAHENWRRRLMFLWVPGTGGVAFFPLTLRHAFLSGADFMKNRLIAPSGYVVQPPRTLVYYGAHELTHIVSGEFAGPVGLHLAPRWVREGIADYAALGPVKNIRQMAMALDMPNRLQEQLPLDLMRRYSVYAHYRLLVAYYLERENWTPKRLFNARIDYDTARKHVLAALAKRPEKSP